MAIEFECPSCHRTLRVKDALAGQRGKCPLCHQSIQVPVAGSSPPALAPHDPTPTGPPVRRRPRPSSRKKQPSRPKTNTPLLIAAAGGAVGLVLVILVVALLVGGRDNGPAAAPADQTLATGTPAGPAPAPTPRVRVLDLASYVPAETTMAFGVRFGDEPDKIPAKLAAWRVLLGAPLASAGLQPGEVAEVVFACDPGRRHVLAGFRTRSAFAEQDLRKRLGCESRGEEVGKASLFPMSGLTAWGALAACFFDGDRTVLIGHPETLKAVLAASTGSANASVQALGPPVKGPGFWVVAEMNDAVLQTGHRLLPSTWQFPAGSRDAARAMKSFGVSVEFADKMNVQMQVECRDDEKAQTVAGLINGVIALLEHPPKPTTRSNAAPGAAGPGAGPAAAQQDGSYESFSGEVGTSSGQSPANASLDGPRAHISWETSPTGAAARFANSFFTALALAPLTPTAEGEQLFPGPMRRLSSSLLSLQAAKGAFPLGAAPREDVHLLQRVSWMAQILPHLGLSELYERIDFKTDWDEGENRAVADTIVEAFLDPRAEEFRWDGYPYAGMALTHYVGMAGLGRDAAELPADDPRAGIFGYERAAKPEDITDGAANTIMLISAGEICGPWMSPGGSTVRGAREPYFAGMSGFGAPGSQPGAVAAFADGTVRFIAADTDPKVFAAMCTMHGKD